MGGLLPAWEIDPLPSKEEGRATRIYSSNYMESQRFTPPQKIHTLLDSRW
jgi:hypothetical protein